MVHWYLRDKVAAEHAIYLGSLSALHKINWRFRMFFIVLLISVILMAFVFPLTIGLAIFTLALINYIFLLGFRFSNTVLNKENGKSPLHFPTVADSDLPTFSIIIPLKNEDEVIEATFASIEHLDYPKNLLDITVVVEETDISTLQAVQKAGRFLSKFKLLKIPELPPFTKARALLHAIKHAKGQYITVYDAESRPEPQQLRKAAASFLIHNGDNLCLQAKIEIQNKNANWITRNFAAEYYEWYSGHLKYLSDNKLPFGLGGNSFFVSRQFLLAAGAWDPCNVTEDADLAVRLGAMGGRFKILESVTKETCPESPDEWINQRTRWNKGLMKTQLVHYCNFSDKSNLGFKGGINFWGPMFSMSLLPFFNLFIPIFILFGKLPFLFPILLMTILWLFLIVSLGITTMMNQQTYRRMGLQLDSFSVFKDVVMYLLIHMVAGFKGYLEYFFKPLHWHKTKHLESDNSNSASTTLASKQDKQHTKPFPEQIKQVTYENI